MSLTIGITSYNRGKYLSALLESLKDECIQNKYEIILIDNFSTEQLVFDTIEKYSDIITKKILRKESNLEIQDYVNDEYKAKNLIIENSSNDIILFVQDDMQYVGYTGLLQKYLDDFYVSDFYCMTINAIRQITIDTTLEKNDFVGEVNKTHFKKIKDNHWHTVGFFKKNLFNEFGNYRTDFPTEKSYWGAGEIEYDLRIKVYLNQFNKNTFDQLVSCTTNIPLFITVWNDSRGGYAFLRDKKRYGEYISTNDANLYYEKLNETSFNKLKDLNIPISFGKITQEEFCKPINWLLQRDNNDEPFKYPQSNIIIEGPVSNIDV